MNQKKNPVVKAKNQKNPILNGKINDLAQYGRKLADACTDKSFVFMIRILSNMCKIGPVNEVLLEKAEIYWWNSD